MRLAETGSRRALFAAVTMAVLLFAVAADGGSDPPDRATHTVGTKARVESGDTGRQAQASATATVSVPHVSVPFGGSASVPVTVRGVTAESGLGSYDIDLDWDPGVIEVLEVTGGDPPFDGVTAEIDTANGAASLQGSHDETPGPTGDVRVAELAVEAVCLEPGASTPLILTVRELTDGEEADIPVALDGGAVTCVSQPQAVPGLRLHQDSEDYSGDAEWDGPGDGATGIVATIEQVVDEDGNPVAAELGSYSAELSYDGSCVSVRGFRDGRDFTVGEADVNIDDSAGEAAFSGSGSGDVPDSITAFAMLRLVGTADDVCTVTMTYTDLRTADGEPVQMQAGANPVEIELRRGDIRRDDEISIADALFGAQYLADLRPGCVAPRTPGGEGDTSCAAPVNMASVRHDGDRDEKSIADVLFIAQYLADLRDSSYEPPQEAETLNPGEVVSSEEGVTLGATSGLLDEAVEFTVEADAEPTSHRPLPEEAAQVGDFHRISTDRLVDAPDGSPMLLGLPVPDDVDPSRLAVLAETPFKHAAGDQIDTHATHFWNVIPGSYDSDDGLLMVRMPVLLPDGIVVTLAHGENYDSPEIDILGEEVEESAGTTSLRDNRGGEVEPQRFLKINIGKRVEEFHVRCVGPFDTGECTSTDRNLVQGYLDDVYDDYVGDFKKPRLARIDRWVGGQLQARYLYKIRKDDTGICTDAGGMYIPITKLGITCHDGSGSPSENTTRMEFFHSVQFHYGAVRGFMLTKPWQEWVIEGTASFVENPSSDSSTAVVDTSRSIRSVDVSLLAETNNNPQYRAQDFWVYLINSLGTTPEAALEPVFQEGGRTQDAASTLSSGNGPFPSGYSLSDAYWGWAKNQAFESEVTQGIPWLNGQCVFNPATVSGSGQTTHTFDPTSSNNPSQTITVGQTTAHVVRFNLQGDPDAGYVAELKAQELGGAGGPGHTKFYESLSSPSSDCIGRPDSPTYEVEVPQGSGVQKTVFALIATDYSGRVEQFEVDVAKTDTFSVDITRPNDGETFPEGSDISFTARIHNPGVDGQAELVYDGATLDTTPHDSGDQNAWLSTREICPTGHYPVVRFVDDNGTLFADEAVEINIGSNNPGVVILKPGEGVQHIDATGGTDLKGKAVSPTCNDPDSSDVLQSGLTWTDASGTLDLGQNLSLPRSYFEDSTGSLEKKTVDLEYEFPEGVETASVTLTPCSSVTGDTPAQCLIMSGVDLQETEERIEAALGMAEAYENLNEVGKYQDVLENMGFDQPCDPRFCDPPQRIFPAGQAELSERFYGGRTELFTDYMDSLFEIVESRPETQERMRGQVESLESDVLGDERLGEADKALFDSAATVVLETANYFDPEVESGAAFWRSFQFVEEPEEMVASIDQQEPTERSLRGYMTGVVVTEAREEFDSDTLMSGAEYAAVYGALDEVNDFLHGEE